MKKIVISLVALFVLCTYTSAQDEFSIDTTSIDTNMVAMDEMMQMFTNDIKIDIDTVLFPIRQASFYMTDATPNPAAVIMTLIVPQPYAEVNKYMQEGLLKNMQVTVKTNQTLRINNKTATHISGISIIDGKNQNTEIYIIEENENQTMMITGVFEKATSEKYIGAAQKAAFSAHLDIK